MTPEEFLAGMPAQDVPWLEMHRRVSPDRGQQILGAFADLWAEHYDRELSATNAFDVQSEVAAAVSDVLKNVLTGSHVDRRVAISTTALTSSFSEGRVGEGVRLP